VIFVPASPPNALEFSTIEEALRQALTEAESEKVKQAFFSKRPFFFYF
jgi:hypothetical protein